MSSAIGVKIKNLRTAAQMTQEELGQKIGKTKATINKYETGIVANIPRPVIEQLADALHVSPGYLMGWDESGRDTAPVAASRAQLSEEEEELLRIYKLLTVKDRHKLLTLAYQLEDNRN